MSKAVMQQALEALQAWQRDRKAFVLPDRDYLAEAEEILSAALAEPEHEPVAWMVYTEDGQSVRVTDDPMGIEYSERALPLYTTPPQRKPLTDEQIEKMRWHYLNSDAEGWSDFARAVERAHGIGGEG